MNSLILLSFQFSVVSTAPLVPFNGATTAPSTTDATPMISAFPHGPTDNEKFINALTFLVGLCCTVLALMCLLDCLYRLFCLARSARVAPAPPGAMRAAADGPEEIEMGPIGADDDSDHAALDASPAPSLLESPSISLGSELSFPSRPPSPIPPSSSSSSPISSNSRPCTSGSFSDDLALNRLPQKIQEEIMKKMAFKSSANMQQSNSHFLRISLKSQLLKKMDFVVFVIFSTSSGEKFFALFGNNDQVIGTLPVRPWPASPVNYFDFMPGVKFDNIHILSLSPAVEAFDIPDLITEHWNEGYHGRKNTIFFTTNIRLT